MKISVIVPVYNTGRYVERCMTALAEQDYPRSQYEVIAVDNGSTDDSVERLSNYPVTVVHEARQGSYAARNAGVRVASGQLLAFTDSDCAPVSGWLGEIDTALSQPACGLVLGRRRLAARSSLLRAINSYENTKDAFTLAGANPLKYYGYTNNMGVRRELYERYGPFVERDRGADTIFVRAVVDGESCDAVRYTPGMAVDHLEMKGFGDYLEKVFIYGRSRKRYRHIKVTEALDFSDRLAIFRQVVRDNAYSPTLVAALAGAMVCSMAAWQLGSWAGALESVRGGRR